MANPVFHSIIPDASCSLPFCTVPPDPTSQLEAEVAAARHTVERVRTAAESNRRLVAALMRHQIAELRAECAAVRTALAVALTSRAHAEAARALTDVKSVGLSSIM